MRFDLAREFLKVVIQVLDGVLLDGVGVCPQFLVVGTEIGLDGLAPLLD